MEVPNKSPILPKFKGHNKIIGEMVMKLVKKVVKGDIYIYIICLLVSWVKFCFNHRNAMMI